MFCASAAKYIKQTCQQYIGSQVALTNFTHDITFSDGEISMLVSDKRIFNYYYQHKIPTLCTDKTGRTLAPGIYLNKTLEATRKDCATLMPLLVNIGRQHGQNYGKNSVHIVSKDADCQHLYSLFFDLNENEFLQWLLNNSIFLTDFIAQYQANANELILEAKCKQNRIVLPLFSEIATGMHIPQMPDAPSLSLIHHDLKTPIHFSPQQSKTLALLVEGKTAKEMAKCMQLSHRTIEHYLEKIRKQLGCTSIKQVLALYGSQLHGNFLKVI